MADPALEGLAGLREDQAGRWKLGQRVPVEAYLARQPGLAGQPEDLLDLIYAEVLLREEAGEAIEPEEYLFRFPALETALRRQFAIHEALGDLVAAADTARGSSDPEPTEASSGVAPAPPLAETLPLPSHEAQATPPTEPGPVDVRAAEQLGIPGYEILEEVGRGGMGVVYRARQVGLNRLVALKMILSGQHAGPAELRRFRTEAEAIARLRHPNVVQIYEVGECGGLPYFSLEYCPGGALDRKLAGNPLPAAEAASLVRTLALAVQAAHDKGVIHRDLKPQNVLFGEDGAPRITDFGLARKMDEQVHTQSGQIMGTPSYMPPEQASGKTALVGPPCDVYSLGAILYECLTGRPPFRAASPLDTLIQITTEEPAPPTRLNPQIPQDLETICLKCLQKDPRKRYAGAALLAEDLRRFLSNEPILARPVGVIERTMRWMRRHPARASLLGLGLVAATALVAVWIGFTLQVQEMNQQLQDSNSRLATERHTAIEQQHKAEAAEQLARVEGQRARQLLDLSLKGLDNLRVEVSNAKSREIRTQKTGLVLYRLAQFYARAAEQLSRDQDMNPADRASLRLRYAQGAVKLLIEALNVKFFETSEHVRDFRNDPDLKRLAEIPQIRASVDYRKLLEEIR